MVDTPTETKDQASSRYKSLEKGRQGPLDRARLNSTLTIPSLIPPDNFDENTQLQDPVQNIGTLGVNNLAAKMTLALLPPNTPFFRHDPDEAAAEALEAQQEGTISGARKKLAKYDRMAMKKIEASGDRPVIHQANKHLLVSGNVLLDITQEKTRLFGLTDYVNVRSPRGELIELIIRESIARSALPPEVLAAVQNAEGDKPEAEDGKPLTLYTHVTLNGETKMYERYQEIGGVRVKGSEATYKKNDLPYLALRFTAIDGQHYGRSFVEDLYGDLSTLEGYVTDIRDTSQMASKVIFLVSPNGVTRPVEIAEASNGDFVSGDANDITTLQLDKYSDLRLTGETAVRTEERLKEQFLLRAGAVRDSERTTATEIRFVALELDDALSGVHSLLSQEFQRPYIHLKLKNMKDLPELPADAVDVTITTGLEALGRGHELQKLEQWMDGLLSKFGPEGVSSRIRLEVYAQRTADGMGLDVTDMLIPSEEAQQTQTNNQMTDVAMNAAPQVLKGMIPS